MIIFSLRDKLVLAFLALLLFSFALTGTIFWWRVQSYTDQLTVSQLTVAASLLRQPIQRAISLNRTTSDQSPGGALNMKGLTLNLEALVRPFPGIQVLLTGPDDDAVIYPPTGSPVVRFPVQVHRGVDPVGSPILASAHCFTSNGETYACVAQPAQHQIARLRVYAPSANVKNVIFIEARGSVQAAAAKALIIQMAGAVAAAVIVALVIALVVVRYITRPLLRMTAASEAMAGGDYNQHISLSSSDEVGQLARSFNKMAYEVQRARQLQREFVANVSHDLKTPLTSIIGFSQILADGDVSQPMTERAVEVINKEARRMQRLTQDLLDLTRLEAGQLPFNRQTVDLTTLLGDIFQRYTTLCPRSDITMRDHRATEPLFVTADPDRLSQVVVNLLDNAIKFCRSGGYVELASQNDGDTARFWIINTGEGLASAEIERVFDRFYRADHARAHIEGGTGLGLAIVQEIIRTHGGHVWIESEQGAWVSFLVRLPRIASTDVLTTSVLTSRQS